MLYLGLLLLIQGLICSTNATVSWPEGYILESGSISPNGRYGVLAPTMDEAQYSDGQDAENCLVDLKTHENLMWIDGSDYFHRQNRRSLSVHWSTDSKWCVAEYGARFGFSLITVLQTGPVGLSQVDIGKRIHKQLDLVISKCAGHESTGDGSIYFRLSADRKVQVRALACNNPKRSEEIKTCCAVFRGTFDLSDRKWTVIDTHPTSSSESEDFDEIYCPVDSESFPTGEQKAASLDGKMNAIYRFLRSSLPRERFAALKKEQIAWLKKRDAIESTSEQCSLLAARIKELQDLAW